MKNKRSQKTRKLFRKNKSRKNRSTKNKRGGFFGFFKSTPANLPECNANNLVNLKTMETMHANYQKCCPKGFFGRKNSSPYCKQLDMNFQASFNGQNDSNEYYGTPDEINQMKQNNQPMSQAPMSQAPMSQAPMSQTPMPQTPMPQTPMPQTPLIPSANSKENPNMAAGKKRRTKKQHKHRKQ